MNIRTKKPDAKTKIALMPTEDVVDSTSRALIDGLAGIASADRKEIVQSISRVFQNIRGGHLLLVFKEEWSEWRKKGLIKDDYQYTEQHRNCLHELLAFLDTDIPDEARFNAIKNIILIAAAEDRSDRDSVLPHQYIKICRELSSEAILVLLTAYERMKLVEKGSLATGQIRLNLWADDVANRSGLIFRELVLHSDDELIAARLLNNHFHGNVSIMKYDRLTTLGFGLCSYIEHYDTLDREESGG